MKHTRPDSSSVQIKKELVQGIRKIIENRLEKKKNVKQYIRKLKRKVNFGLLAEKVNSVLVESEKIPLRKSRKGDENSKKVKVTKALVKNIRVGKKPIIQPLPPLEEEEQQEEQEQEKDYLEIDESQKPGSTSLPQEEEEEEEEQQEEQEKEKDSLEIEESQKPSFFFFF